MIELIHGDSAWELDLMADETVDAVVCDPPAGIAFMGKSWDKDKGGRDAWIEWLEGIMRNCLRVLKPGGHCLVWALPRTSHWTAMAVENAGFEIRDVVTHCFGTGFPKSLNVSKAIDKAAGAEREVIGFTKGRSGSIHGGGQSVGQDDPITAPATDATDAAKQWDGFGTALKPASEHWILARKPLIGTVAANVLEHGTGALNIDACRVGENPGYSYPNGPGGNSFSVGSSPDGTRTASVESTKGRWPANLVLSGDAVEEMDRQSGHLKQGGGISGKEPSQRTKTVYGKGSEREPWTPHAGSGGASRFFYCAKPSKKERGEGNVHPTVKSIVLMRWLIKLITPPGGTVLDPFMGSGTTGLACIEEGFDFIGIEQEEEYFEIAKGRLDDAS